MKRPIVLVTCLVLACPGAWGCTSDSSPESGVVEPGIGGGGKADFFADQVTDLGELAFGESRAGAFERDFQFDGYTFRARAGAQIVVQITHAGSSASLDTTLFLYGPLQDGASAPQRVGIDNDSGWGKLSKIATTLEDGGVYVAVVGTGSAVGRGRYTIALECAAGECAPDGMLPSECPEEVLGYVSDCITDLNVDYEFSMPKSALMRECISETRLTDAYNEYLCSGTTRPEWCELGASGFVDEVVPGCGDTLSTLYPDVAALGLATTDVGVSEAITTLVAQANAEHCASGGDGGCQITVQALRYTWTGSTPPALLGILADVRESLDPGPGPYDLAAGPGDFSGRLSILGLTGLPDLIDDLAGVSAPTELGNLHGTWQADWGDHDASAYVLHYASRKMYVVVFVHSAWEA